MVGKPISYRTNRAEQAQSLVEFAIAMVFLFFTLMGVLDLGRAYYVFITLEDGAGDAAVFLAVNPLCTTSAQCANPNNAEYRAHAAVGNQIDGDNMTVQVSYPTQGKGAGNIVTVEVDYPFRLYTPIISQIVGSKTLSISARASQPIITDGG